MTSPDVDPVAHNREAWDKQVAGGNEWTRPVSSDDIARARNGDWSIVLIGYEPVPRDWFPPDLHGVDVLCLASGGGQQGPILAAAGANVTVFDNSPKQLEQDRMVAERDGLDIATMQGDMRDLSACGDESFDLVYHPVSNLFCPEVRAVWRECFRVLRPGGSLLAGFMNPDLFIFDREAEDVRGELVVRHSLPYSDLTHMTAEERERFVGDGPLEYSHTLADQIGGQLEAGFVITALRRSPAPRQHHREVHARLLRHPRPQTRVVGAHGRMHDCGPCLTRQHRRLQGRASARARPVPLTPNVTRYASCPAHTTQSCIEQTGGPEVMHLAERKPRDPGRGEVLVRIAAAGVNFIDVYYRTGRYPAPPPFVPGLEGAGVVEKIGPDVGGLVAGDRVAWSSLFGSYATHVTGPADRMVKVPSAVDDETAAALDAAGHDGALPHPRLPRDEARRRRARARRGRWRRPAPHTDAQDSRRARHRHRRHRRARPRSREEPARTRSSSTTTSTSPPKSVASPTAVASMSCTTASARRPSIAASPRSARAA